jgi:hypothetical protein
MAQTMGALVVLVLALVVAQPCLATEHLSRFAAGESLKYACTVFRLCFIFACQFVVACPCCC